MFQWFTSESDISIPSVMRILTSTEDETIKGSYLSEELNRILNQVSAKIINIDMSIYAVDTDTCF